MASNIHSHQHLIGPSLVALIVNLRCCTLTVNCNKSRDQARALLLLYRIDFYCTTIGGDFRFEVPGQSSVGLIGGGRGQWLGRHHGEYGALAYNGGLGAEPPVGSRGRAPGQRVWGAKPP